MGVFVVVLGCLGASQAEYHRDFIKEGFDDVERAPGRPHAYGGYEVRTERVPNHDPGPEERPRSCWFRPPVQGARRFRDHAGLRDPGSGEAQVRRRRE